MCVVIHCPSQDSPATPGDVGASPTIHTAAALRAIQEQSAQQAEAPRAEASAEEAEAGSAFYSLTITAPMRLHAAKRDHTKDCGGNEGSV